MESSLSDPIFLKAPDGNYVHFEWATEKNEPASVHEGRPMFDKVLFMHVVSPGAPKSAPCHVVERETPDGVTKPVEFFVRKYGEQIKAFKSAEIGGAMAGTPLDQLATLDISTRATLRAMHIHTVEALAELGENGIQNVGMGARQWKAQAVAYLEAASGGAPITRLIADNEKLTMENARLSETVRELADRMAKLEAPGATMEQLNAGAVKRGPGRPRSEAA